MENNEPAMVNGDVSHSASDVDESSADLPSTGDKLDVSKSEKFDDETSAVKEEKPEPMETEEQEAGVKQEELTASDAPKSERQTVKQELDGKAHVTTEEANISECPVDKKVCVCMLYVYRSYEHSTVVISSFSTRFYTCFNAALQSKMKTNGLPAYNGEPAVPFYWPKDKVLCQRLELVCYCIGKYPCGSL